MTPFKLFSFILIYLIMIILSDSSSTNETNLSISIQEKQTKNANNLSNSVKNNENLINSKINTSVKTVTSLPNTKLFFQPYPNEDDIPESYKIGFYFFIGLSITGILFILIKINRMRLSRAERKYGVHGDRTTQELTPLPMAIEDDSENEDHTVFDINSQTRVS